jgi:hypothetical protein
MRQCYSILTIVLLSIIFKPTSLNAQGYANASASITVTVLPSVGAEVQEKVSLQKDGGSTSSEFLLKVNDMGKYSLQIFDEANKTSTGSKVLEAKGSYRIKEDEKGNKRIVQLSVLSS